MLSASQTCKKTIETCSPLSKQAYLYVCSHIHDTRSVHGEVPYHQRRALGRSIAVCELDVVHGPLHLKSRTIPCEIAHVSRLVSSACFVLSQESLHKRRMVPSLYSGIVNILFPLFVRRMTIRPVVFLVQATARAYVQNNTCTCVSKVPPLPLISLINAVCPLATSMSPVTGHTATPGINGPR